MPDKSFLAWLGIEDFFNYYLPGLLWVANGLFLIQIFNSAPAVAALSELGKADQFIFIAVAVVTPYIVGIALGFLGSVVHEIDKKLFGTPEEYVLNAERKRTIGNLKVGSALGKGFSRRVKELISTKLGQEMSASSLYWNVHYSLQFAPFPRVQDHIARISNLMNLHEGLISPFLSSALLLFVAYWRTGIKDLSISGWIMLAITIGIWWRYHYLREVRTKHAYRYFFLWHTIGKENSSNK
jgi:hypothetical protein